jgi:hypothetical protein
MSHWPKSIMLLKKQGASGGGRDSRRDRSYGR